ncbi:uncharacterized protein JCM10292_007591 [Rhodotorula paludigena]|uniref:uncharacterized protein n=1 Tax=Rhodotorula paludigena TaxID=86838 RepID=UPI00316D4FE8
MPTARSPSPAPSAWPTFLPPSLAYLSDPRPHPVPRALPPSARYRPTPGSDALAPARGEHTLQSEMDALDAEEEAHYGQMMDTRHYGHAWLVPLGRQNTHDEDADSTFSTSPHHNGLDGTLDLTLSPHANGRGDLAGGEAGDGGGGGDGDAPVVDLDAEIEDADAERSTASGGSGGMDADDSADEAAR